MHQLERRLAAVPKVLGAVVPAAGAAPEAGQVLVVAAPAAGVLVVLAAARQLLAQPDWVFLANLLDPAVLLGNNPVVLLADNLAQLAVPSPGALRVVLVDQPVVAEHCGPPLPFFGGVFN